MSDMSLLDWVPPVLGATFDEKRDGSRLAAQYLRVQALMLDGKFRTLAAISAATGDPQASVSARLRDMRRNGFKVEREYFDRGIWLYRATRQEGAECATSSSVGASAPS